jgi:hypothetical protein
VGIHELSEMTDRPKPAGRWYTIATVGMMLALLMMVANAWFARAHHHTGGGKSLANCRQIIIAIRLFAADEGGRFPDSSVPGAKDSNSVFRHLIVAGCLEDEKIFGCGNSPFLPDGNIGSAPDFAQAVQPGENHWAMTKGLEDNSSGGIPLVYENPAEFAGEPLWNADAAGQRVKGRAWTGAKIIVGTLDTSVELMKLASLTGTRVRQKALGSEGKNIFTQYTQEPPPVILQMLDIAR